MTDITLTRPTIDLIVLAAAVACMFFSAGIITMELVVTNAMRKVLREADAQRLADRIAKATARRNLED